MGLPIGTEGEPAINNAILKKSLSSQAGYLPVPLRSVPPESFSGLRVYLKSSEGFSLYRDKDLDFGQKDYQRLIDSGVDFVYVSVHDHQQYYRTLEKCIGEIVQDKRIQQEKKAEMLYFTSLELANQLLQSAPDKKQIRQAENISLATVKMIMNNKGAFHYLYEVSNHDFYTATHMVNVCTSTVSLGYKIGIIDSKTLERLGSGALLHDIGKIFIPPELLNSSAPLKPEELDIIRKHVDLGYEHLEKVADLPPESLCIVAEHHERMDGTGYPKGLKGDEISVMGRLAGIVDTFDAMTSVRPYRDHAFTVEEVLTHLEEQSPSKFDKEIVKSFAKMIESAVLQFDPDQLEPDVSELKNLVSDEPQGRPYTRKHVRHYLRVPMSIMKVSRQDGQFKLSSAERLVVYNISRSGIGFLSPYPFPISQTICITLPRKDEGPTYLLAAVVRNHDHGGGWYSVGASFMELQSEEMVERIQSIPSARGYTSSR